MPDTHPAELIEGQYTCVRCRDIHHRSKFTMNEKEFVIDSMDEVLAQIPNDSPLVYVFNAMDFPMGINPEIFKHRNPRDLYFIMTKTDNLFLKSSGATHDYCKTFLNDYLGQKYRVPPENIFIASGKKRWRVKRLYEFIPNYSYFVGYTNCGKSTLIKSVKVAEELKKFPEYTNVKDFGKTDKLIDKTFAKIGPGISHLPGFTREIMPVYINGEKTIYDVPGFTSNKDLRNICQQLDSKAIAHMFRGKVAQKAGDYKSRYFTAKGPHVLSIEGIAFLELPANTMYQIRNVTDLKLHEFKNIAKVESVLQNIPPAMYPSFLLESKTPELSQLNKLYVPPFYGTIDLVLENIGYINIKPVGAKKTNDLIKVYLHPSVRAVIRQPIMEYINKTFTGRDDRGEPLPKADWVKKSTFDLKRYNNDEPFLSRLLTEDAVTTDCVVDENTKYDFWKE
ncbi:Genetic interactor of prohibitins 3, mitochondrial [Candida viswanathii]|uniref:Genetic interactor of prohibitins 3, mitochondrial n=1 Tax=Candida viswanathii TaxID=5486 RepID=A0A367YFQ1_9ASCO|nr:Genetic interactor of prohibitins 3, mitochondrial [Candida viswanathii]